MYYEIADNNHGLPYNPLKGCVVPRPIAWISTLSKGGRINLAPFSFFNMFSYDPPYIAFSGAGHVIDQKTKDTIVNVEETGEFVYNLATFAQKEAVTKSALITDRSVDELAAAGLQTLPSRLVRPPRVKGAPVHFECRYHRTVELKGNRPVSAHKVVFGEVIAVHIDDSVIDENGIVDILRMRPLSRLGYRDYTSVESTFRMDKHTPEEATTKKPAAKYSHVLES